MEIQTLIIVLIVLAAAGYILRILWRAIRVARAGTAGAGCATGGCGCTPAAHGHQQPGTTTGA